MCFWYHDDHIYIFFFIFLWYYIKLDKGYSRSSPYWSKAVLGKLIPCMALLGSLQASPRNRQMPKGAWCCESTSSILLPIWRSEPQSLFSETAPTHEPSKHWTNSSMINSHFISYQLISQFLSEKCWGRRGCWAVRCWANGSSRRSFSS